MKVYNINPISFMAQKLPHTTTEPKKDGAKFTKDSFYSQIEGFLNKQYDKKKYLKLFSDGVDKIVKQNGMSEYTSVERKYISNLLSIMDMSENLSKIPDNYLKTSMENLLKYKK